MIYVIGTKGQQARMYLNCDDGLGVTEADAQRQLKSGEIYFLAPIQGGVGATINSAGTGFDAHVVTLSEVQASVWTAAKTYRENMRNGGCSVPLGHIQTDSASQRLIDQKAASAMRWLTANQFNLLATVKVTIGTWSVPWTMTDNSVVIHSAQDFVNLHEALTAHTTACQNAGAAIRAKIFTATTVAGVQAIDITAGYPSS